MVVSRPGFSLFAPSVEFSDTIICESCQGVHGRAEPAVRNGIVRDRGRMSFVVTLLVIQMIPVEGLFISQYKMLEGMALLKAAHEGAQSDYIIERGGKKIASMKKAFQAASARSGAPSGRAAWSPWTRRGRSGPCRTPPPP